MNYRPSGYEPDEHSWLLNPAVFLCSLVGIYRSIAGLNNSPVPFFNYSVVNVLPVMVAKSKPKKSWREKLLDSKDLPKVEKITGKMSARWGTGTVVIPAPIEVDEFMKKVPKGKVTTINEIREALANRHKASIGCPITTGIFAWIAAHAAVEDASEGADSVTPYWRTLKSGGVINEKYPGGAEAQKKILEGEGHKVVKKGKNYVVADYEKSLVSL